MKKISKPLQYHLEVTIEQYKNKIQSSMVTIPHTFNKKSSIQNRRDAVQKCMDYIEIFDHATKIGSDNFVSPSEIRAKGHKNFSLFFIDVWMMTPGMEPGAYPIFGSIHESLKEQIECLNEEYYVYKEREIQMGQIMALNTGKEDFDMVDDTPFFIGKEIRFFSSL